MAWTSGFFNSVNGDRLYNADEMSAVFEGLISDGIFEAVGNKFVVEVNSGMTIQINTGRGWFGGKWVNNDSVYLMTLEDSDVLLNRYCAVCIKVDLSDTGRTAVPYLKYGEFATTPIKPVMERSDTVKEYCLAYVYIPAGVTSIVQSNIADTREDLTLCGYITGLVKWVDSTVQMGTWTPKLLDNSDNDISENFNVQVAKYTLHGDICFVRAEIIIKTIDAQIISRLTLPFKVRPAIHSISFIPTLSAYVLSPGTTAGTPIQVYSHGTEDGRLYIAGEASLSHSGYVFGLYGYYYIE